MFLLAKQGISSESACTTAAAACFCLTWVAPDLVSQVTPVLSLRCKKAVDMNWTKRKGEHNTPRRLFYFCPSGFLSFKPPAPVVKAVTPTCELTCLPLRISRTCCRTPHKDNQHFARPWIGNRRYRSCFCSDNSQSWLSQSPSVCQPPWLRSCGYNARRAAIFKVTVSKGNGGDCVILSRGRREEGRRGRRW